MRKAGGELGGVSVVVTGGHQRYRPHWCKEYEGLASKAFFIAGDVNESGHQF